jgi:hypothetical protein
MEKRRTSVDYQNLAIDEYVKPDHYLALENQPTHTIDVHSLFTYDSDKSGLFDLSDIASTSFGKLLDSLPVPVVVIDRWFCIAFVNQGCEKLSVNYKDMKGSRFTDLLASPDDSARADTLKTKTMTLLERVFTERRPQRAETILEIGTHRTWARLHLRTVRMASDRHMMVIIEDVTQERTRQRISQKGGKELRAALVGLEERVQQIRRELSEMEQKLQTETDQHGETKKRLRACLENEGSTE